MNPAGKSSVYTRDEVHKKLFNFPVAEQRKFSSASSNNNKKISPKPQTCVGHIFLLPTAVVACKWEMFTSTPSTVRGKEEVKMTNNRLTEHRVFQRET